MNFWYIFRYLILIGFKIIFKTILQNCNIFYNLLFSPIGVLNSVGEVQNLYAIFISQNEVEYIEKYGCEKFEDLYLVIILVSMSIIVFYTIVVINI